MIQFVPFSYIVGGHLSNPTLEFGSRFHHPRPPHVCHLHGHSGRPNGGVAGGGPCRQGTTLRRKPRHARSAAVKVAEDGPILQVLKQTKDLRPRRGAFCWKKTQKKVPMFVVGWCLRLVVLKNTHPFHSQHSELVGCGKGFLG